MSAPDRVYGGDLPGPQGRILIDVEEPNGGRGGVAAVLRNLPRTCEDETEVGTRVIGGRRPGRDGRFEALALQEPELSSLHLALTLVEGRILPSGRAKGFIFSANDPYDPVDTNDPAGDHNSSDECWTDGKVRWQAKPIRRSKPGAAPVPEPPAASEQANASGDRRGSYVGSLGSGREPVKLEIAGRGRRARAMFEGVLVVNCDQGAEGSLTPIGPIEVPLRKDGRFRYARFTQDPLTLDRTFTRVAGRVRATDRASGYVSSFFDPWDPFGEPNQRECTRLRAGWQAERRN